MNYVMRKAKEHTLGCVASSKLYNPGIKQLLRVTAQCLGDVRAHNIVEANKPPQGELTLTGRVMGWGAIPAPETQIRERPSTDSERPLRLALLGAYENHRVPSHAKVI